MYCWSRSSRCRNSVYSTSICTHVLSIPREAERVTLLSSASVFSTRRTKCPHDAMACETVMLQGGRSLQCRTAAIAGRPGQNTTGTVRRGRVRFRPGRTLEGCVCDKWSARGAFTGASSSVAVPCNIPSTCATTAVARLQASTVSPCESRQQSASHFRIPVQCLAQRESTSRGRQARLTD